MYIRPCKQTTDTNYIVKYHIDYILSTSTIQIFYLIILMKL